ncbi:MAG: response regulator [Deltaproteobacteria bacterium]|nr:response regulator [Deltaproteobacteria bacterium]
MEERKPIAEIPPEILIVEDSPVQAEKLKYILEEHGLGVVAASNGVQALKVLKEGYRPFLIISDIMMPEMNGYEFCKGVRENKSFNDIPVILLTSLSDLKDIIRGLECGANSFIVKPFDEKNLISRVEQIQANIDLRQRQKADGSISVCFSGDTYQVAADKTQILDFLLSTYEDAYRKNMELIRLDNELSLLNEELEKRVEERTAELEKVNEEIRLMSQQLWQASKLATMGELAASIAHELNNPLATVNLRIEALLGQVPGEDPKRRSLEIIEQELDRMADLVANLLQFSRRSQPQISTVNVCQEIENTLNLIYYHLRKVHIEVQREFSPDIPYIHADRQQLRQLFLNLFTNSSDAMSRGGTLGIRVYAKGPGAGDQGSEFGDQGSGIRDQGAADMKPVEPRTPTPDPPGKAFIVIEITDTGTGIAPEVLPKVMEPFFTTKPEGKGTGLGLPICRRIVQEHNGCFEILSEGLPGKGTTVRISLLLKNGMNVADLKKNL